MIKLTACQLFQHQFGGDHGVWHRSARIYIYYQEALHTNFLHEFILASTYIYFLHEFIMASAVICFMHDFIMASADIHFPQEFFLVSADVHTSTFCSL